MIPGTKLAILAAVLRLAFDCVRDRYGGIHQNTLLNVSLAFPSLIYNCSSLFWELCGSAYGVSSLLPYIPEDDNTLIPSLERFYAWAPLLMRCSLITNLTLDVRRIRAHGLDGAAHCTQRDLAIFSTHPYPLSLFISLVNLSLILGSGMNPALLLPFLAPTLKQIFIKMEAVDSPSPASVIMLLSALPQRCPKIEKLSIQGVLQCWEAQAYLSETVRRLLYITDLRLEFPGLLVIRPFIGCSLKSLRLNVVPGPLALEGHIYFPLVETLHLEGEAEQLGRILVVLRLPRLLGLRIEATLFRSWIALLDLSQRIGQLAILRDVIIVYHNVHRRRGLFIPSDTFASLSDCRFIQSCSIVGYERGRNCLVWASQDLEHLVRNWSDLRVLELRASRADVPGALYPAPVCSLADLKVLGRLPRLDTVIVGVDVTTLAPHDLPFGYDTPGLALRSIVIDETSVCDCNPHVVMFVESLWTNAKLFHTENASEEIVQFCFVFNAWLLYRRRLMERYWLMSIEEHLAFQAATDSHDDDDDHDEA